MASPQYDAIGSAYLYFKSLPPVRVETANLRIAIAPYVAGARVLDLACGAGHYSRLLLEWGAASVVGVDISSTMIAVAERQQERLLPEALRKRLRFEVGDAARLGKVDVEPNGASTGFDLVTGMWLLNYAGTTEEVRSMCAAILTNLKPGGLFVGVLPEPTGLAEMDELKERYDALVQRRWDSWGITVKLLERVEEEGRMLGWKAKVQAKAKDGGEGVNFTNYHLGKEVYEEALNGAAFEGNLEWRTAVLDERTKELAAEEDEDFWREYLEIGPHFGLLFVRKND